ncbi:hypothetical protein DI09_27p80 [Mitosporidium daphniae]|uniref:Uncharacterized protein n=1 Tax=Mitosporidium daphniae TaxID=1485682 RepID=A0A098VSJ2_9MICR|nr:uncharacterized protein DI09_27p80 [Mitosporidium daphniae]KGG51769.1 hypothetical protein DI09_27p80 [Mitosporidium daphniae]|eukprot:XP_013238221.1 uncharacterized protein DI09_27p80 [Mitosporidium daphniae]
MTWRLMISSSWELAAEMPRRAPWPSCPLVPDPKSRSAVDVGSFAPNNTRGNEYSWSRWSMGTIDLDRPKRPTYHQETKDDPVQNKPLAIMFEDVRGSVE